MRREFTGRHALMVFVGAFGVIIAVNLLMAFKAVSTFPGLEVRNSYIASQTFDAERAAQMALGWTTETEVADGVLRVAFADAAGQPAAVDAVEALLGRTTSRSEDQTPQFSEVAPAVFEAPVEVARGQWTLQLRALSEDGTPFRQRISVYVR